MSVFAVMPWYEDVPLKCPWRYSGVRCLWVEVDWAGNGVEFR
jgi:hypothetical protein